MIKKGLEAIVGKRYVLDDEPTLDAYGKDLSLNQPRRPSLVVKPKNGEEVQKVVKLANKQLVPVIPVSSALHFHGETIPEQGGIVVDLRRMDKVIQVDSRNRKVKVEPGVTWGALQETLKEHDQMALNPLFPHPQMSALTSSLERNPMVIPKYEYAEPVLTMEVVLPQGDVFRTGTASAANTEEAYPEGPGIDFFRLFQGAQGTLGIVTWLNIKTEYRPKHQKVFFIPFKKIEDAVEPIYRMQRRHIGNECFLLNNFNLALLLADEWPKDFEDYRATLPPYTLTVVIAGAPRRPLERIAYEEEALHEIASQLLFQPAATVGGVAGLQDMMLEKLRAPQEEDRYWKTRYKGSSQDIFFITTMDRAQAFHQKVLEVCATFNYPTQDLGVYLQPLERGRACHLEFSFPCDLNAQHEREKVNELYQCVSEEMITMGAFFSRPYGPWADMVYRRATTYTTTLKEVKKVFDPNNILNPGKLCY
jgi:FAD/FMN-containing dehydrogenase